jgi:hypothetical protein
MTVGDGILWSTVLVLLAVAVHQISVHKKWKLVGKGIGFVLLLGAAAGLAIWRWDV